MLILISIPPWFNWMFGEEYAWYSQGIIIGAAQIVLAAGVLKNNRLALAAGVVVALVSLAASIWLLFLIYAPEFEFRMWNLLSAAVYIVVLTALVLDTWKGRTNATASAVAV